MIVKTQTKNYRVSFVGAGQLVSQMRKLAAIGSPILYLSANFLVSNLGRIGLRKRTSKIKISNQIATPICLLKLNLSTRQSLIIRYS